MSDKKVSQSYHWQCYQAIYSSMRQNVLIQYCAGQFQRWVKPGRSRRKNRRSARGCCAGGPGGQVVHWIDGFAVLLELEVQVSTRGISCVANPGNCLAGTDTLAGVHQQAARVRVQSSESSTMVQDDRLTVSSPGACDHHLAVGGGMNRITLVSVDVEAVMVAPAAQAETGADLTLQGPAKEGPGGGGGRQPSRSGDDQHLADLDERRFAQPVDGGDLFKVSAVCVADPPQCLPGPDRVGNDAGKLVRGWALRGRGGTLQRGPGGSTTGQACPGQHKGRGGRETLQRLCERGQQEAPYSFKCRRPGKAEQPRVWKFPNTGETVRCEARLRQGISNDCLASRPNLY